MADEALPPPPWFWELLASADRSLRSLCRYLEQVPEERLRQYQAVFDEAKWSVNPYDWGEAEPYVADWPSEDGADDFSAWVVMQGREFYEHVRSRPHEVQHYLELFREAESGRHPELSWDRSVDRDDYRGWQRPDYIATPIFRARFGDNSAPDADAVR